jgi:hypothetical protein
MKQYPMFSKSLTTCYIIIALLGIWCDSKIASLQKQNDSLKQALAQAYKPGLGEFMSAIQVHHAKLWFAGQNQNWELATFEMGEIQESVDDINKYCTDRPEIRSLPMLYPALDSLNNAVKLKSLKQFQPAFIMLTKTCNNCHQTTHHGFNVIKIPDTPPFTNQDFKAK